VVGIEDEVDDFDYDYEEDEGMVDGLCHKVSL
jgi:hypothetical protein